MRSKFLVFSPPDIGEDEIDAVLSALRSGWPTTGAQAHQFEQEFAEYVGAPAACAVSSCTAAMHTALASLGIGPGDQVITSPMTFCSTAHVIEQIGATPIFADVDPDTLNISPSQIERIALQNKAVKAILPVHLYGHPCDLNLIFEIARRHRLAIVEDVAHSLAAKYRGKLLGSFAEHAGVPLLSCFSFYTTKNLNTVEGGMISGSRKVIDEARLWSLHGIDRDAWQRQKSGQTWAYDVVRPGFKHNMTDVTAAMGRVQLRRLPSFQMRRREIANRYLQAFSEMEELHMPVERAEAEHAWHLFVIRLNLDRFRWNPEECRNRFIEELNSRNIGASVHFVPIPMLTYFRDKYAQSMVDFPVAGREFQRIVSLPLYTKMTDADVTDVIDAVKEIVRLNRR